MGLCVCKGVSPSQPRVPKWGMTGVSRTVVGAGGGSARRRVSKMERVNGGRWTSARNKVSSYVAL